MEKARTAYEKLNQLVPGNVIVLNNLAWLLQDIDLQKGIAYARDALESKPDNAPIQDTLAMLLLKSGNNEEALRLSASAAEKLSTFVEVQINYARALKANGQNLEARRVLEKILSATKNMGDKKKITEEIDKL